MSYLAHCEGCNRDTDWIDGKCIECGQGPYHVSIPKLREEIITLREQRDKLLAGCKTVMEHDGMCMYGCPEMIDKTKDEQKAFRLGSAMSYAECANEVRDVIFEVEGEK